MNFFALLAFGFIMLKLTNFIDWSWWLVTLPIWGGLALQLTIIFAGVILVSMNRNKRKY